LSDLFRLKDQKFECSVLNANAKYPDPDKLFVVLNFFVEGTDCRPAPIFIDESFNKVLQVILYPEKKRSEFFSNLLIIFCDSGVTRTLDPQLNQLKNH